MRAVIIYHEYYAANGEQEATPQQAIVVDVPTSHDLQSLTADAKNILNAYGVKGFMDVMIDQIIVLNEGYEILN